MAEKNIIIHDTVYTYIEFANDVKTIIDTESFQRLKNIRQLTVQHLYPSANHTRFEHSLGVMHLALRVFDRIKSDLFSPKNQESNSESAPEKENDDETSLKDHSLYAPLKNQGSNLESAHTEKENDDETSLRDHLLYASLKNQKSNSESAPEKENDDETSLRDHLLYASLLHDVGHAPLSHAGELLYSREEILEKIGNLVREEEKKFPLYFLNDRKNARKIALHELMSCYVIIKKFRNMLKPSIDLEFIFRIICGCYYENINSTARNIIISIVNSDTFDVDKLDYLLRDNKMVGYIGPQIDIERLLMSVTIGKNGRISFTQMGISAIQRVIDCRDNLYLWVYNHHTVVYTDYLYQECFIHFDRLYRESGGSDCYEEKMPLRALFSCEAIADDCVSDSEVLSAINRAAKITRDRKNESKTYSVYTEKLMKQLVERKYLKPLWKTLNQYNQFLETCKYTNKNKKAKLTKKIEDKEYRRLLVREIRADLGIAPGGLFIIGRENKFYEYSLNAFGIKHYDKFVDIKNLLPSKNYGEKYEKTAFYVFYDAGNGNEEEKKEKKEKIENLLRLKLTEDEIITQTEDEIITQPEVAEQPELSF